MDARSLTLIQSSAEVFGGSPEAWLKASLLEVGILGLSIYRASAVTDFLIARVGAVGLAALSLMTLHTGVKNNEAAALNALEASSEDLAVLHKEQDQLVKALDTIPATYISRRETLVRQLHDLTGRLQLERSKIGQSATANTVERTHLVEALMRVALMFLNITFAHALLGCSEHAAKQVRRSGRFAMSQ